MTAMINFCNWFFNQLPNFLLSEPINYLFGLMLVTITITIILQLRR